jgi:hypothetical protein
MNGEMKTIELKLSTGSPGERGMGKSLLGTEQLVVPAALLAKRLLTKSTSQAASTYLLTLKLEVEVNAFGEIDCWVRVDR